jgi:Microcystin-dependent protein
MDGTIATIMLFGGNFAPLNWLYCDGSLLSISEYEALFSLIGTTYGGDGQTTFALPDLRGRVAVGAGQGPGLNNISLGERAGAENVTLTQAQMPAHSHGMSASVASTSNNADGSNSPAKVLATAPQKVYTAPASNINTFLGGANVTIQNTGGNTPVNIVQAYQVVNFVICTYGIYPSRS